ncbi:TetR/AcrR family transcriptional regulator [Brucella rhizosphaerae]|uniref:TetR/AcrR family transcriptional regulator n=1 Tax=Brucella rhizosphaerae TaxID=571254 RepID=UPI00046444F0|nr:TetR/AcrR family transcriptional regulator [Brucella rhizosphaerae]
MRLTRKQSQDQTRQRLIAAGQASIADEGVSATSIRHICEQAGHSQGAFYSNFATKDDLLLEIMRVHVESEVASLRAIIAEGDPNDPEGTMARFAGRLAELAAIPEWSLLSIELQLHAQRDPAFALRYNEYKAACHVEFARLVEDLLALNDLSPAMTPHQTGIALYALWSGLIVQGSVEGALPRDQVLLAFFRAITHRAL